MQQMSDADIWDTIRPEHLWVVDKLLLAKQLGYRCGPAGVRVSVAGHYIVRPCVNFRMMSRGATVQYLSPDLDDLHSVPDGHFWCEIFIGRHLSFDYHWGQQVLAVEGFRDSDRLDRFCRWEKVSDQFVLPDVLKPIAATNQWLNVEVIGDKIIEVHFRYNDDFANHESSVIVPVWKDQFYPSACGDRVGFLLK